MYVENNNIIIDYPRAVGTLLVSARVCLRYVGRYVVIRQARSCLVRAVRSRRWQDDDGETFGESDSCGNDHREKGRGWMHGSS